jgi:hypothetical protein
LESLSQAQVALQDNDQLRIQFVGAHIYLIVDVQEAKENMRNVQKISHAREVAEASFLESEYFEEQRERKADGLVVLVAGVCYHLPLLAQLVELIASLLL